MNWVHDRVKDAEKRAAYQNVEQLAEWTPWRRFSDVVADVPRLPGVYLFGDLTTGDILYVGHAGPRNGSGKPQGLYGRLNVYRTGKGAVSGFGEAALDRALASPMFVETQLSRIKHDRAPRRAREWAAEAVSRLLCDVSWALTPDKASAVVLEKQVERLLRPHGIWNR